MEKISLLLSSLLFLALSLPIHARESQFFAKTTRLAATDEPAAALPPQSHVGYGLYGSDPDQRGVDNTPSSFADVDFTAAYDNYRERSKANNVPSSFPNAEFSTDSYDNKKRSVNNIPSSFANANFAASYDNYKERSKANDVPSRFPNAEPSRGVNNVPSSFANADFAASYDNYRERSKANDVPEFHAENYENKELPETKDIPSTFSDEGFRRYESKELPGTKNIPSTFSDEEFRRYESKELPETKNIPSTFSDEEFRRYESARVPDFSSHGERHGMSDTRFMENGKYFYDVNAERNGEVYEPARESSERYGSYGNKDAGIPEEFVP